LKANIQSSIKVAMLFLSIAMFYGCQQLDEEAEVTIADVPIFSATLINDEPDRSVVSTDAFSNFSMYDAGGLSDFIKRNEDKPFTLDLPDTYYEEVTLNEVQVMADNYKLLIHTEAGVVEGERPQLSFYTGKTDEGGHVSLMVDAKGNLSGYIDDVEDELVIENISKYVSGTASNQLVVHKSSDELVENDGLQEVSNGTILSEISTDARAIQGVEKTAARTSAANAVSCEKHIMEIFAMTSYKRFKGVNKSSTADAAVDILDKIHDTRGLFDDFGIELRLVEHRIISNSLYSEQLDIDQGVAGTNDNKTLANFGKWIREGNASARFDAALFFMHNTNNEKDGNALINSMCSNNPNSPPVAVIPFHTTGWKHRNNIGQKLGMILGATPIGNTTPDYIMSSGNDTFFKHDRWNPTAKTDIRNKRDNTTCMCKPDELILFKNGGTASLDYGYSDIKTDADMKIGDFDGDGKDDMLHITDNEWLISYAKYPGSWKTLTNVNESFEHKLIGDFDGDGKDEIMHAEGNGWHILDLATGNYKQVGSSGVSAASLVVGDFNGDGKDDLLRYKGIKTDYDFWWLNEWAVAYATSNNTYTSWVTRATIIEILGNAIVGDFNGDGLDDVSINGLVSYAQKNADFTPWVKAFEGRTIPDYDTVITGDLNGDNKDDVVLVIGSGPRKIAVGLDAANDFKPRSLMKQQFGANAGYPLIGDFDGNGTADIVLTRGIY
ncbi:MAG: VCBS repeat-containing protein, partial [Bacteroidota bacterium]